MAAATVPTSFLSVPPGKIGLLLSVDNSGATVAKIEADGKFRDEIEVGDRIVTIDGARITKAADLQVNNDKVRVFGIAKKNPVSVQALSVISQTSQAAAAATPAAPMTTPTKSKPTKSNPNLKEKRLKRFRSSATIKIQERIDRALHQRLFLIEASALSTCSNGGPSITFSVLGSTGNVYEVTIQKVPHCSCPDAAKGNLCKHLLFVMLKVVGLPANNQLVYQSAYLSEELDHIFSRLQARLQLLGRDVVANEEVQKVHAVMKNGIEAEEKSVARKEVSGADCPICFDDLGSDLTLLTFCKGTCGTNFHKECISTWTRQPSHRSNPTCPACRQAWHDVETGGKCVAESSKNEGYDNLGRLQGQSPVRDTSTYHSRYDSYKRRRNY
ncbi:hypothetical protein ACHAWO_003599 [Cyclotella atomus]|uniref:Uncharacterized protein n=1 Tax=Cyclotella atomus TaxID=382360 RepID=A0ABD3QU93_9STRA